MQTQTIQIPGTTQPLLKTNHFARRQARRRITDGEVALALTRGKRFYEHGDIVYFLGRRHIPDTVAPDVARRAEGTVVVVGRDRTLLTTYRNTRYCRKLRKRNRHHQDADWT